MENRLSLTKSDGTKKRFKFYRTGNIQTQEPPTLSKASNDLPQLLNKHGMSGPSKISKQHWDPPKSTISNQGTSIFQRILPDLHNKTSKGPKVAHIKPIVTKCCPSTTQDNGNNKVTTGQDPMPDLLDPRFLAQNADNVLEVEDAVTSVREKEVLNEELPNASEEIICTDDELDNTSFYDEEEFELFVAPLEEYAKYKEKPATKPRTEGRLQPTPHGLTVSASDHGDALKRVLGETSPKASAESLQSSYDEVQSLLVNAMKSICDVLSSIPSCYLEQIPDIYRNKLKQEMEVRSDLCRKGHELKLLLEARGIDTGKPKVCQVSEPAASNGKGNPPARLSVSPHPPCAEGFFSNGSPLYATPRAGSLVRQLIHTGSQGSAKGSCSFDAECLRQMAADNATFGRKGHHEVTSSHHSISDLAGESRIATSEVNANARPNATFAAHCNSFDTSARRSFSEGGSSLVRRKWASLPAMDSMNTPTPPCGSNTAQKAYSAPYTEPPLSESPIHCIIDDSDNDLDGDISSSPPLVGGSKEDIPELPLETPLCNKPQLELVSKGTKGFFYGNHDSMNDNSTMKFLPKDCPYYAEVRKVFTKVFGLKEFRTNQHQAILAALAKKDCFILMPTGGGKSLCYQLTALVTPGVTVVVSPLRSLILDQVEKLLSLKVPAAHLSSDQTLTIEQQIYVDLHRMNPDIKLLYVTPEKLVASGRLMSSLQNLYKRHRLDRFVIDEAHCISQWGHDFRKDYKKLNLLREEFPGVPLMALTATATPRVQQDVLHQLKMTKPEIFKQSFNRTNLKYSVVDKNKKSLSDIADLIKEKYAKQSGVIYCLSRKECAQVATHLSNKGIHARPYHAGLEDNERTQVHQSWLRNKFQVVCATIAFGMGIDKPDVRFVIHFSLPKSTEGYFQESGRAGRDGQVADCILFYQFSDMHRIRRMIEYDKDSNFETRRVHTDNLFRVVSYCENKTDCRRAQLLQYFGETTFDATQCKAHPATVCDNCAVDSDTIAKDVTNLAQLIVGAVNQIGHHGNWDFRKPAKKMDSRITMNQLVDIFKGSEKSKTKDTPLFNAGSDFARSDADRLFRTLILRRALQDDLTIGQHDNVICYVKLGPKALDVKNGHLKISLAISTKKRKSSTKGGKGAASMKEEEIEKSLEELKSLRGRLAASNGVRDAEGLIPSYLLETIARELPQSIDQLEGCGLDPEECAMYGQEILEVMARYASPSSHLPSAAPSREESTEESPYWNARKANIPRKRERKRTATSKRKTSTVAKENVPSQSGSWLTASQKRRPGLLQVPVPKRRKMDSGKAPPWLQ